MKANHLQLTKTHFSYELIVHHCKETRARRDTNVLYLCRGLFPPPPYLFITCKKSSATKRLRDINKPVLSKM